MRQRTNHTLKREVADMNLVFIRVDSWLVEDHEKQRSTECPVYSDYGCFITGHDRAVGYCRYSSVSDFRHRRHSAWRQCFAGIWRFDRRNGSGALDKFQREPGV